MLLPISQAAVSVGINQELIEIAEINVNLSVPEIMHINFSYFWLIPKKMKPVM